MDNIEEQLKQMGIDLSIKGEYVVQCHVCQGYMLRKHSFKKRLASDSGIVISAVTENENGKTKMRMSGDEVKEVFLCKDCELKLSNGEVIY